MEIVFASVEVKATGWPSPGGWHAGDRQVAADPGFQLPAEHLTPSLNGATLLPDSPEAGMPFAAFGRSSESNLTTQPTKFTQPGRLGKFSDVSIGMEGNVATSSPGSIF
ncbi:hypothetical protein WJX74_002513 [Apatococcus lobatus]|uniref:Uncharacterized protein n=1 Tax=Apatococcus lobatus TaxID=904363 RepID=A0AAW1QUU7_9CHLO